MLGSPELVCKDRRELWNEHTITSIQCSESVFGNGVEGEGSAWQEGYSVAQQRRCRYCADCCETVL